MVDKQILIDIANELIVPDLKTNSIRFSNIHRAIKEMSRDRLSVIALSLDGTVKDIDIEKPFFDDPLHKFYEIKLNDEIVGKIFINYYPHIMNYVELVDTVKKSLLDYPNKDVVMLSGKTRSGKHVYDLEVIPEKEFPQRFPKNL